jgi:hypothetical protein
MKVGTNHWEWKNNNIVV